jgi:hypothetical protein
MKSAVSCSSQMKSSTLVIAPAGIAEAAEQSVSPFAGIGKHQVVHGSGDETVLFISRKFAIRFARPRTGKSIEIAFRSKGNM